MLSYAALFYISFSERLLPYWNSDFLDQTIDKLLPVEYFDACQTVTKGYFEFVCQSMIP